MDRRVFFAVLACVGVVGFTKRGEDAGRKEMAAFAAIPNARFSGLFERKDGRRPRDSLLLFPEEKVAGVWIDEHDAEPLVVDQLGDVGEIGHDTGKQGGALFDDHQEANGFVDLDHLPRESRLEVAEVAVDYADVSGDIVRKFGSSAVVGVVDVGEKVFEVDARTDGNNRTKDRGKAFDLGILGWVVGDQKRAAVEVEISAKMTAPDKTDGVGGVTAFGAGFGDIAGAFFDMFEGCGGGEMEWERLESTASFVGIAASCFVDGGADVLEAFLKGRG